jgi:hypothetical protein
MVSRSDRRAERQTLKPTAQIKALTWSDDTIEIVCERERLDGFMRYAELVDAVEERLKKTGWRTRWHDY